MAYPSANYIKTVMKGLLSLNTIVIGVSLALLALATPRNHPLVNMSKCEVGASVGEVSLLLIAATLSLCVTSFASVTQARLRVTPIEDYPFGDCEEMKNRVKEARKVLIVAVVVFVFGFVFFMGSVVMVVQLKMGKVFCSMPSTIAVIPVMVMAVPIYNVVKELLENLK